MTKTGFFIAGTVLGGAFAGWHYYYFEELFSALVLFTLIAIPLLVLSFFLAMAEVESERGMAWAEERTGELSGTLKRVAHESRELLSRTRHAA